jgi:opacity protein-like surface antigen
MVVLRRGLFGLAVVAGLAFSATATWAGGAVRSAEVGHFDRPSIWRGLYGGINLGHADAEPDDGIVGGVQVGYNWQNQHIIYGLEADLSISNSDFIDWLGSARGRLGYLLQPGLMVYGTAGLGVVSAADSDAGFVWGLGVEGRVNESMTARLEYLNFDTDANRSDGVDVIRAGLNFKLGR